MPLLPIPEPYDFEASTRRYRASGPDVANLWYTVSDTGPNWRNVAPCGN